MVNGQVLNVTKRLSEHPGGEPAVLTFADKGASEEFMIDPPDGFGKCEPSDVRAKVNGECGEGSCQASMGQLATVATKSLPALEVETKPTYYGDPVMGCESDAQDLKVQDVSGTLCSPK